MYTQMFRMIFLAENENDVLIKRSIGTKRCINVYNIFNLSFNFPYLYTSLSVNVYPYYNV